MSEPRPVGEPMEYLESGREPSRWGEHLRRLTSRVVIPLTVAVVLTVAWFEIRDTERERTAARADELAAAAVEALQTDADLARLLALAAADTAPLTSTTMAALRQTLSSNIVRTYSWPRDRPVSEVWTDLNPDGTLLVSTGMNPAGTYLEVWDIAAQAVVWSTDIDQIGFRSTGIEFPFFSPEGDVIVTGVTAEPDPAPAPLGIVVWNAETGETLHQVGVGRCGAIVDAILGTRVLVTSPHDDQTECWEDWRSRVELIELDTGRRQLLSSRATWQLPRAMSGDGRFVTFTARGDDGSYEVVVLDTTDAEQVFALDGVVYAHGLGHSRLLNEDGSLLLTGLGPVQVWDVATGTPSTTLNAPPNSVSYASFSPDGHSVFSAHRDGLHQWESRHGAHLGSTPLPAGTTITFSLADDLALVNIASTRHPALLLSTGLRRDVDVIVTCFGAAGRLSAAGGRAAITQACGVAEPATFLADLGATDVMRVIPGAAAGNGVAMSPDGSRFVRPDAGDATGDGPFGGRAEILRIRDAATGEVVVDLEAPRSLSQLQSAVWSADARLIAAVDSVDEAVLVWHASSGRLANRYDGCWFGAADATFSPDGSELAVSCRGRRLVALSSDTWDEIRTADLEQGSTPVSIIGFDADGSTLLALDQDGAGGSLYWIDAADFGVRHAAEGAFGQSPTAWAIDPAGTLVAVGTAGGSVQVWDVEQRSQIDEIGPEAAPIAGVAFAADGRLAVLPRHGNVHLHTLDPDEVLEALRASVTRDFTPAECARYELGDDCPLSVSGAQIITGVPSGSAT